MIKIRIIKDSTGNPVVLIPEIIFKNRQNIDWNEVEEYLNQYVGECVRITDTEDIVYLGKEFPDEFAGSKYTRNARGARAKAKANANAAQGILEMLEIAAEKTYRENHKTKHNVNAANGWYYFTTRFALPGYNNDAKLEEYNIYSGRLVVNCNANGKLFLYDLVDIKKEASNPLKTNM